LASSDEVLLSLYDAAIAGADPAKATSQALAALDIPRDRRVLLFAFGKASGLMAGAAVSTLLESLHQVVAGVVVSPEVERAPYPTITVVAGDHPLPGPASFQAANEIGRVARGKRTTDVAVVLVSGGATSLTAGPLAGQPEKDLADLHRMLLSSGMDILRMNAVRKRFSRWAAGRLAVALAPAAVHCLAVSDVPGDDLSIIGSGPCTPDENTAADVLRILRDSGLEKRLTTAHRQYLDGVMRGVLPETPKRDHPAFAHVSSRVVITNRMALDSAARAAESHGMRAEVMEQLLSGSADSAGEGIARKLIAARGAKSASARCFVWGGETTVDSTGSTSGVTGGGRCQELALAAARVFSETGDAAKGIRLLAAGTDGRDGATDAAGALVDSGTWSAMRQAGVDPDGALAGHESTRALAAARALIPRRRTGTNVMDVAIGIVE
jgi:hydroxypyruvate reductase